MMDCLLAFIVLFVTGRNMAYPISPIACPCLSLACIVNSVSIESPPHNGTKLLVKVGNNFTRECIGTNMNLCLDDLYWTKNGVKVNAMEIIEPRFAATKRYSAKVVGLSVSSLKSILFVTGATLHDDGVYRCVLSTDTTQYTQSTVVIQEAVKSVKLYVDTGSNSVNGNLQPFGPSLKVTAGTKLDVKCEVDGGHPKPSVRLFLIDNGGRKEREKYKASTMDNTTSAGAYPLAITSTFYTYNCNGIYPLAYQTFYTVIHHENLAATAERNGNYISCLAYVEGLAEYEDKTKLDIEATVVPSNTCTNNATDDPPQLKNCSYDRRAYAREIEGFHQFQCYVMSKSAVTITWTFKSFNNKSTTIGANEEYKKHYKTTTDTNPDKEKYYRTKFSFLLLEKQDNGVYKLTATNSHGSKSHNFHLILLGDYKHFKTMTNIAWLVSCVVYIYNTISTLVMQVVAVLGAFLEFDLERGYEEL